MFFSATLAVFGLVASTQAHIIMTYPPPFQFEDQSNKQAPLNGDGADFPCKLPAGSYIPGPQGTTEMPIGSTHALSFIGSAVHGGGSCQVSITYDKKPTKNSVWKVIHSIQGGCPMRNIAGNNGNDAQKPIPDTYSFKIPNALPAGEAVLAWTWFNNVGNREMYMNCAPIKITGSGASDKTKYNSLPALYMANVGNGCTTPANKNVRFPNPGSSLEINNGGLESEIADGTSNCEQFGGNAAPAPVPVPSSTTTTRAPQSSSAAGPKPTTTSVKVTPPGGVFVTVDPTRSIVPTPSTTAKSSSKTTSQAAKPTTSASKPASSAKPSSTATPRPTTLIVIPTKPTTTVAPPAATGATGAQTGPCTQEGRWNCINANSFQQCASGSWSQVQSLAAGTKCTTGQSDMIDITHIGARDAAPQPASKPVVKTTKRVTRVVKKHIHRHKRQSL